MRTFTLLALVACRGPGTETEDTSALTGVDDDADGYAADEDCNDADAAVNPGAPETCNGVDDDCDGEIDVGASDQTTFYADSDGDGYGAGAGIASCDDPGGYATEASDCDDADPAVHPGASEEDCADPKDYNCDGATGFVDTDGDGSPACQDCDDADAAIHPSAAEICNAVDDDCDGELDEAGAGGEGTWYADADGDGHGDPLTTATACAAPEGYVDSADDCDDAQPGTYPGAAETCDGLDQDCDGEIDEGASDTGTFYTDADGDGAGDDSAPVTACTAPDGTATTGGDCDDADASVHPGATQVCNGKDDDCTGMPTDEADGDGDGSRGCEGDCEDGDPAVHPGATEICNGVDDDCSGDTDGDATDRSTFYEDVDGDGYGSSSEILACAQPTGTAEDDTDCDDADAAIHPGATETWYDGVDQDCGGGSDYDQDGDGVDAVAHGGTDCNDRNKLLKSCGDGAGSARTNCLELLKADPALEDGTYFIDPDGNGTGNPAFKVYCDMTTDGGGWTLVDNDATKSEQFTTREAGANPDLTKTRGSYLPDYKWATDPQLLCKSDNFSGSEGWLTLRAKTAQALEYPTKTTVVNATYAGGWEAVKLNGNTNQGLVAWIYTGSGRFGSVWIGNGGQPTCACDYYAPSPQSGLGKWTPGSQSTCSTWVR